MASPLLQTPVPVPPVSFSDPAVRIALSGTRFAAHFEHFATVDSTNTMLLKAAAAGAPEGTVYLADRQTAGRGRGGHTWHSAEPEGLYLSVLAQPALPLRDALCLSLATGLAAQTAIAETTGVMVDIRWPNDLLLPSGDAAGPARKCGGILVETAVEPGDHPRLRYAVIGVGLNLNQPAFPPELAALATSLRLTSGREHGREAVLIALLRAMDRELTGLEADVPGGRAGLLARFAGASSWVRGKAVKVPEGGGYTGTTAGLDAHGFLLVDTPDGRRTVLSGGVREL